MSFRLAELLDLNPGPEFSLHGFIVRRTFKPVDLGRICQLRHEVYEAEGYIDPKSFPDGSMTDRFDATAEHIVAYTRKGEIGGAMRASLPGPEGLPTLNVFNIQIARVAEQGVIDIGKFAILKEYRARLLLPILKAAIESAITHRAPYILAFCPDRLAQSYLELGCPSSVVPEQPLSSRMLRNRAPLQPYFDHAVIRPRLFSIERLLLGMGLSRPLYLRQRPLEPSVPLDRSARVD